MYGIYTDLKNILSKQRQSKNRMPLSSNPYGEKNLKNKKPNTGGRGAYYTDFKITTFISCNFCYLSYILGT